LLCKGEKASVRSVVECIGNGIALIPFTPPPSTLTNHVPITIHMDMMQILVSHYIQSYNKVSHKLLMLVKIMVLGNVRREKR
jgi:hypothetical protein